VNAGGEYIGVGGLSAMDLKSLKQVFVPFITKSVMISTVLLLRRATMKICRVPYDNGIVGSDVITINYH